jgi:hypothetical protein
MALGSTSGKTVSPPPESCAAPATLMGFYAPTATWVRRYARPGIPAPARSASRVSHPLDGFLPPNFPASRTGATHGVHPPELFPSAERYAFRRHGPPAVSDISSCCSEDQEVEMPCGSRASFPAEIRTVSGDPKVPGRPMLSWALSSPLQSLRRRAVRTVARPLPSCAFHPAIPGDHRMRHSRALPTRRLGKTKLPGSLEVFHQDPPSTLVRRQ